MAGGLNLYGFCGNDGVNRWDYLGHTSVNDTWEPGPSDDTAFANLHPPWVQKGGWDYSDPGRETEIIRRGFQLDEGPDQGLIVPGWKISGVPWAAKARWTARPQQRASRVFDSSHAST